MYTDSLYRISDTDSVELQQAVYGVLHSVEGLDTFANIMTRMHAQHWYKAIQHEVARHAGDIGCMTRY